jgi:DNA mismatch endonuclease (patch repair protein)
MPEPLDDITRRRMQRQRRRDTALEIAIRGGLHAQGHRFRVDHPPEPSLRCRGDIVFTRRRVVVFVDGCFWHGCPLHATEPKNNAEWWREKLAANMARDRRHDEELTSAGWTVLRIWEHENADVAIRRVVNELLCVDRVSSP